MSIRRLVTNGQGEVEISLSKDEAIIVLDCSSQFVCLHLISPSFDDLNKLNQFEDISNLRFIGCEEIYKSIENLSFSWPEFSKKIFCSKGQKVIFDSDLGKLKFEKKTKKNVLIVDDSRTIQKLLIKVIEQSENLSVVGVASCPSEAKRIIENSEKIDLITLDIHMPEMNGVEFMRSYLRFKKIPVVMISSVSINEGPLVMEALSLGAYTYIKKPSLDKMSSEMDEILTKLDAVANVKQKNAIAHTKTKFKFNSSDGLVAIGSSTGGTQALEAIFTSLPDEIPPIVVVQHIPAYFSKALAERLDNLCAFTVKEAEDGEFIKANTIYIAPGGKQMKLIKRGREKKVLITDDPPVNRFKPSVDYLFSSISALEEKKLLGIVLTGMGKDGAKGLLELKQSGAKTIAQDEESSVVFGMPKEAIALGAAQKVVSLNEMSMNIVLDLNRIKL